MARELFTRDDAAEVARRHLIAFSPFPVDWHATHCTCGLGDQNHDFKAHWARYCVKAAAYVQSCEMAGIPLKWKDLQ